MKDRSLSVRAIF